MKGIIDIQYVRFSVSDLVKQQRFLDDFGMVTSLKDGTLIGRGTGSNPYLYVATQGEDRFIGMGFAAETEEDLKRIAAIDGVSIEPITDMPGGGLRARLTDPDGWDVDIVYGVEPVAELKVTPRNAFNSSESITRLGERVSLTPETHIVKRMGHVVINATDFRVSEAWYKERIGFITSDEIYMGDESNTIGAFMRVNRGDKYVDHHTMFCMGTGKAGFNHCAYEVYDWDTLMQGHDRLKAAEYEHRWGIGKHILGSQVFDYWRDPHGFTIEHFTDGDLMNVDFGSHKAPVQDLTGALWGPEGRP
jgi:predicted enzyme related to lactoylglutathione lyase/catechol 2,3-dioxygenase-like lactoylglutathione lyase family enzyme